MNLIQRLSRILSVSIQWWRSSRTQSDKRTSETTHVLFCMCDHYEPGTGRVDAQTGSQRVEDLLKKYPAIADRHHDSDGRKPTRTWFYPPHYHLHGWLKSLVSLCEKGYGEIELHLHHGKHQPDTSENLKNTLIQCVEEYSKFGIFGKTKTNQTTYGFIHGDWALDNSRNGQFCGVNDEISILKETGCYADFTFPSCNEANPRQINTIHYAIDDKTKPKSHDRGVILEQGKTASLDTDGTLLIVQGPLHPHLKNGKLTGLGILGDSIDDIQRATPRRIDEWVKTGISVKGKENWIVVKTHTHGASDAGAVLGDNMHELFDHLETNYRDRPGYALHYVTARELFNIIKAAESGVSGSNPIEFKDYLVGPPSYDASPDIVEASPKLQEMVARTYRG